MKHLALPLLLVMPALPAELTRERSSVVVHEWGTFTSIATETGAPARWAPLSGATDLPCFVAKLGPRNFKDIASGLVRMETPVLYFYSPAPVTLSVRVGFPEGWITEWYPNATRVSPAEAGPEATLQHRDGEIVWNDVHVAPGQNPQLPVSHGASHYFAARETDSAPVRIGTQWEKLIFYRGVGSFSVPLRPVITPERRVKIANTGAEAVPLVILFENRGGKVGYRTASGLKTETELTFPELTNDLAELRAGLTNHLVEFGLYRKEAAAMVETWRDSWFEEGMRLFYIVPREMVDRVLPLDIQPAPSTVARVFVGRVELLSPGMRQRIESLAAANDIKKLQQIGRFLGPFVTQMERTEPGRPRPAAIQSVFQRPFPSSACVD
jgi:hypothetical protein